MPKKKQKLELTWIGKGEQPQLEPRILVEDPSKSYGDPNADNMLIHGDNLLALKALEQGFAGKVKCIFIDPPYNTGSAFDHYDDGIEHSLWLSLMRDRLLILKALLSDSGSLWITIDDNECHYLKVLCDEIFGRKNFIATVAWQKKYGAKSDSKFLSESQEHVLCFCKNIAKVQLNRLPRTAEQDKRYKNPDNDPRGPWTSGDLLRNEARDYAIYTIVGPSGREHNPPAGTSWRFTKERHKELETDNRIWFGPKGSNVPRLKRFLSEVNTTVPATTWWPHTDAGHNDEAKKEIKQLFAGIKDVFATPKPERLIARVLTLGSDEHDIVLDSFLGSGTTAAVAQKMNRKWIGIELGNHCATHCAPRLQKVCDGTDQGGISESVDWKGGGGFKYYELAPSLLKADSHGNWVISDEYNADMLAAAMAKHEAFNYSPDSEIYWKQGKSSEKDFIFTTTSFVQVAFLDRLHEEMQTDEHLLICCKKYSAACVGRYPNIEIRKIPKMLLGKCEFGRDDYSLNIVNVPTEEEASEFVPQGPPEAATAKPKTKRKKGGRPGLSQPDLFATGEES